MELNRGNAIHFACGSVSGDCDSTRRINTRTSRPEKARRADWLDRRTPWDGLGVTNWDGGEHQPRFMYLLRHLAVSSAVSRRTSVLRAVCSMFASV